MATSSTTDYINSRPIIRTKQSVSAASPRSPRTPLLGRSISSTFGSPGAFRTELEDCVIYELGATHVSGGFSGESRPRCRIQFGPDFGRRVGDFRQYEPGYVRRNGPSVDDVAWTRDFELYTCDVQQLDLGLVEDKLERAIREIHTDFLQLDTKQRKAVLVVPSLLPVPLLNVAVKVLFHHFAQPPSITVLSSPMLACIGAGLRDALVVDIGWEETVVTAIGEYKEIAQRRSVRAGRIVTQTTARLLETAREEGKLTRESHVDCATAREVTERMAWCRSRGQEEKESKVMAIPLGTDSSIMLPFQRLSEPAESILTEQDPNNTRPDDHEIAIPMLVYRVLLALPQDLRAACISRIIVTGGVANIPGLRRRLLQELDCLVASRGWDRVFDYGSAASHRTRALRERTSNMTLRPKAAESNGEQPRSLKEGEMSTADYTPPSELQHDDVKDPISIKVERQGRNRKKGDDTPRPRMVETVGAWAGASLLIGLRVKGVHEIEREDYVKHGLRDLATVVL